MTTSQFASFAFQQPLSLDRLAQRVPAAFTDHAAATTGPRYVFISTRDLVAALMDAGFVATQASQAAAMRPTHGTCSGFSRWKKRCRCTMRCCRSC
jgi:hypothetical protein